MATNIWEDIKLKYHQGNAIIRLIMINIAVHVAIALLGVFVFLATNTPTAGYYAMISEWLYFPSEILKLPLRIWTIVTYMFLHAGIWHLATNLLVLYFFGRHLNDLLSDRHVWPIYIWGGLGGAIFFMIGFNIFPPFAGITANLVGASASVMAVVLATATFNPKGTFHLIFIGPVQLQYIAAAWVVYNLIVIPGGNPGGALAHLGGAFMGWFYVNQSRRGRDLSKPVNKVLDLFTRKPQKSDNKKRRPKAKKQTTSAFKPKMRAHKGGQKSDSFESEYSRSFLQKYKELSREECLDSILDKIKRSGYDSLSKDEKVFLDRYRHD
ncbi:MAG: rhomboid family intramembrane serine protease [Aureispira sp.]